jgi:hypothetical protein
VRIRTLRIVAGFVLAPMFFPAWELYYAVFYSGIGRRGGRGSDGVPITLDGLVQFVQASWLPVVAYSYVAALGVGVPAVLALAAFRRLDARTVLFASLAAASLVVVATTAGAITFDGFTTLKLEYGLFALLAGAVATGVVSLLFCLIAGIAWPPVVRSS